MTGFTLLEVTSNLSFEVEESQRGAEERKAAKEGNWREAEEREAEVKTRKEISLIYFESIR